MTLNLYIVPFPPPHDFQTFLRPCCKPSGWASLSSSLSLMRALDVMHDLPVKDCLCLRLRQLTLE